VIILYIGGHGNGEKRTTVHHLSLCFFVAGGLGFGFGHELSGLGLAIPASAFVVDATVGVDPDLAAAFAAAIS
jgi:uncharacterized membrane protein YccC